MAAVTAAVVTYHQPIGGIVDMRNLKGFSWGPLQSFSGPHTCDYCASQHTESRCPSCGAPVKKQKTKDTL